MISDIWRCDGRETLPLMPMSGRPLFMVMHVIRRCRSADGPWRPTPEESDAEAER